MEWMLVTNCHLWERILVQVMVNIYIYIIRSELLSIQFQWPIHRRHGNARSSWINSVASSGTFGARAMAQNAGVTKVLEVTNIGCCEGYCGA